MRKIFVFVNVSLDGYVEGPGHDLSWTHGESSEPFAREQGREVDAILFGRRTYELMAAFWPTRQAAQAAPDTARFMNEKQKYVASHSPFDPGWDRATVLSGHVVEAVRQLKARPGGKIAIFGSNTLCASLVEAGLIDEFQIMVNPVALGAGTSLFRGLEQPARFTLTSAQPFPSGVVLLTYNRAGARRSEAPSVEIDS